MNNTQSVIVLKVIDEAKGALLELVHSSCVLCTRYSKLVIAAPSLGGWWPLYPNTAGRIVWSIPR